jgi:hypothetical protein
LSIASVYHSIHERTMWRRYDTAMKYKTTAPKSLPRLGIDRPSALSCAEVGFLQVRGSNEKIILGDVHSREFRLVRCLFSPQNFTFAKYEPVVQTYERVLDAIRTSADALNARLADSQSAHIEVATIVERSVRAIEKSAAGKYFAFAYGAGRLQMQVIK